MTAFFTVNGRKTFCYHRTVAGKKAAIALGVIALCLLAVLEFLLWRRRHAVYLDTALPAYFHYDFVALRLRTRDAALNRRWRKSAPVVVVQKHGRTIATIGGLTQVPLVYDSQEHDWTRTWPCPWNAPAGRYALKLLGNQDLKTRLHVKEFMILRRAPKPIPQGISVLTWENARPLAGMTMIGPDGKKEDWRGMLDWTKAIGADAFWMMASETPGKKPGQVWLDSNFTLLPRIAAAAHARGLKFGLYVLYDLTFSKRRLARYDYAMSVRNGRPVHTRAISLADPERPGDVAALLSHFSRIPDVDYLGIDYIRNALGGDELAERFYADMWWINPPQEWPRLSRANRMVYFARKEGMHVDQNFLDAWQWWRARQAALIVRRIKRNTDAPQPLWAFTLSWAKGHQHGQDPIMMNDAGVDADAVMLYQADRPQFEAIIRQWHDYVRRRDAQILVGDMVDWDLHQRNPDGPLELYRRLSEAESRIYADGPARGVFIHDLSRALWGDTGRWGTRGWMAQAARVVKRMKEISQGENLQ